MMCFEQKADSQALWQDYLSFVLVLYSKSRNELTIKCQSAFLEGCLHKNDPALAESYVSLLSNSVNRDARSRLDYVLEKQSWESIAHGWCSVAVGVWLLALEQVSWEEKFFPVLNTVKKSKAVLGSVFRMCLFDEATAAACFKSLFAYFFKCVPQREHKSLFKQCASLLAQPYHSAPSMQCLLHGILECSITVQLPPQLVAYCGEKFNAWHTALLILEKLDGDYGGSGEKSQKEYSADSITKAISHLLQKLNEDDYQS